ncbi:MAG TPA: zinc-ribbon domain-containing protein [Acidobacteriota bacterium]|jgi:uncharacterized membrane protein|nr:zinc-ribbon domain-containing protein [Acidobacteriota bacterium]
MAPRACAKCGNLLEESARFCPSCGNPVNGENAAAQDLRRNEPQAPDTNSASRTKTGDLQRNVAALLCYILLFISGILFLLIEPYNRDKFIRFHAFQSIFFFIAWVVVEVLTIVMTLIITAVLPAPLDFLSYIFQSLVTLGLLFLWILLMYKAYCEEMYRLPVIGDLAAKQA